MAVDFSGANLKLNQYEEQTTLLSDSESENTLMPDKRLIIIGQDVGADGLLISDNTLDYDWLLSPPRNPVLSLEMEDQKMLTSHSLISDGQSSSPDSKVENLPTDTSLIPNIASKLPASSTGVKTCNAISRRPSPARKTQSTGSRSSTPTARPALPSTTKPLRSSTPTSRAMVAPPSKRSITPTARPTILAAPCKSVSRSSTPTNRPSILAAPCKSVSRSSTPTNRPSIISAAKSASRSSTPTARPSISSVSKSTSRSSTPTAQPSNPSANRGRSCSASKARVPSRGSSPSDKSRPSKEIAKKSLSASESKEPTIKMNVSEANLKTLPKRTSYSPSTGQISNGKSGVIKSRGYLNGSDDVNPVLMGTKMVERVVNMRKLAPPRQDPISIQNNTSAKLSVSQDNSGFGRSLSKKSFDMALRHLDIRRSMPGNMRAMITKVPASSVYSVRSESTKVNASDSPLATSSSENGHSYHQ